MSIVLTINGTGYDYPVAGDQKWGADATAWAAAVTNGMLQKAGGTFQLLAEVDFGSSFGVKSLYYKSRTANVADAGQFRLARADVISWRNQANGANLDLSVDASNNLLFNGAPVVGGITVSDTATIDLTLVASALSADIVNSSITNAMISNAAAIAYSKLNLADSILNADINTSAAIAFSKLAALPSGNILVGSAGNVATSVAVSGDISVSDAGVTAIGANKVTDAMLTQVGTQTFKGRTTGGTGDVETLSATQATAILNDVVGDSGSGGTKGLVPAPASGDAAANKYLKADGAWTQITAQTGSTLIENLGLACSVSGNALTIELKQGNGSTDPTTNSPVRIGFRTAGEGAYIMRSVTGATSVTVPSGATLGLNSGTNGYIYVYAIDNGGTIALGVNSQYLPDARNATFNLSTSSDTAAPGPWFVGGAATLAYRMIARFRYNTVPNGAYSSVPTEVLLGDSGSLRLSDSDPGALASATSQVRTPGASDQYYTMVDNSLTLASPGTYELQTTCAFGDSGGVATYALMAIGVYGSNGTNTATAPTLLSATANVTLHSPAFTTTLRFTNTVQFQAPVVYITTTASVTVYSVPFASMTTPANARITTYLTARRIY